MALNKVAHGDLTGMKTAQRMLSNLEQVLSQSDSMMAPVERMMVSEMDDPQDVHGLNVIFPYSPHLQLFHLPPGFTLLM